MCLACFASAAAAAESDSVPLPDRNPNRQSVRASPVAEAVPAPQATPALDTASDATVLVPEQNPATQDADSPAAPDRNPTTTTVARTPSGPTAPPPPGSLAAVTNMLVPDRNPKTPVLLAPPGLPLALPAPPSPHVAGDVPMPDANPNRAGTLTPAIAAPQPAMDYASILKPIMAYDLGSSDEANIRDVLRGNTAAAAKIKDPAARDFALWYKWRNGPANGNAAAMEAFRLAHPYWPGQDELRE